MVRRVPKKFDMFSKNGNDAVHQMLVAALESTTDRDALCARIWEGMEEISKTHNEVVDTAVRERVLAAVATITKFDIDELYPKIMFGFMFGKQ